MIPAPIPCPLCGAPVLRGRSLAQIPADLDPEPGTSPLHYLELDDAGTVEDRSRAKRTAYPALYRPHELSCKGRR